MKKLFIILCIIVSSYSQGSELSYARTQTSSSYSNKYKLSYSIDSENKIGLTIKSSRDTSGISDDSASYYKFSYRYKFEDASAVNFDVKRSDEFYFYKGQTWGLRYSQPIDDWTFDGGFTGASYTYEPQNTESLQQLNLTLGSEYHFDQGLNAGLEVNVSGYAGRGVQTRDVLSGNSSSTTDISQFISNQNKSSVTLFGEYEWDRLTIGCSYDIGTALIGDTKVTTTEIYVDTELIENITLSASFSRGRTDTSTNPTDTVGFGIGYAF